MYAIAYKLNNSYTTYIVRDDGVDDHRFDQYQRPVKPLEWKKGAKVKHSFHGIGEISDISGNLLTVHFKESKAYRKRRDVRVGFLFKNKPSEIEGLYLCY